MPKPEELARHFPQLEIIELLGQGGMGAVYKARQPTLDRLVAVKILPAEVAADPAFAERFTREARALARLNHPNIVGIHDFGQTDGLYYFIMEYVDGVSLRQLVGRKEITLRQALALVPQMCEALQFAHDEGIVHRDIKPENILIDKRGRVKIADFGLAKLLGRSANEATLTRVEQVMGTPLYMAPEQMQGSHAVDHRADIYSLGVVFYEMLTGELPFGRFAPPSQKVEVDVRLDEVVLRALEREPERRYQHASDVKMDVESIASGPARVATASPPDSTTIFCPAALRRAARAMLFLAALVCALPFGLLLVFVANPRMGYGKETLLTLAFAVFLAVGVAAALSGWGMLRCRWYVVTVIGSALVFLSSFAGNIFGLLIGGWALIVLLRDDVRAAFAATHTARQNARRAERGSGGPHQPAGPVVKTSSQTIAVRLVTLLTALVSLLGVGTVFLPWTGFSTPIVAPNVSGTISATAIGFDWWQGMLAAAVFIVIVCMLIATPVRVPPGRSVAVVACALTVVAVAAHFLHECRNGDLPAGPLVTAARPDFNFYTGSTQDVTSRSMKQWTESHGKTPKTLQDANIVAIRRNGPHLAMLAAVAVLLLTALQSAFAQWGSRDATRAQLSAAPRTGPPD